MGARNDITIRHTSDIARKADAIAAWHPRERVVLCTIAHFAPGWCTKEEAPARAMYNPSVMKQRNLRRWIVFAVLGAHAFVPLAAYASVKAGIAFGDVCSVFAKAQPAAAASVGLPMQRSDRHAADHCAFCPGGAATAAVVTSALPTMQVQAHATVARSVERAAPATLSHLLPPSRAPPATA